MVETVTDQGYTTAEGYQKYEAGTPNIAGGIGLGVAADYLGTLGWRRSATTRNGSPPVLSAA